MSCNTAMCVHPIQPHFTEHSSACPLSCTIEKLNQGLMKVLTLVGHPDRDHLDQTARLTSAQCWLEEVDPNNWPLVLDNVDGEAVSFIKEHLPCMNVHGDILMTTCMADVAESLMNAVGHQHQSLELQVPDLKDATELFFIEAGIDKSSITSSTTAMNLVKCLGCLPLAISHAASFIKQYYDSERSVVYVLEL